MEILAIQTEKEFSQLRETWNKLLSKSDSNTIFLSWEWTDACWRNFGDNEELFILVVRDGNGEIVGIAPFYTANMRFLTRPIKRIGFIGDMADSSEYLDLIIEKGKESRLSKEFFDYLDDNSNLWDLMVLREIPETSMNLKYLHTLAQDREYVFRREEKLCSSVPLQEDWNSHLMFLKPRFRTKIRSSIKRLEGDYNAKFSVCSDGIHIEPMLQTLFELHQRRWVKEGYKGSFSNVAKRQFYNDISHSFLENGWLRFYSMELNGKIIACQFGFEYNERHFYLQGGLDPDSEGKNVGTILRSYIFKDMISRGIKEYDFLGGFGQHKKDWGAVPKYSIDVLLGRPMLKNELYSRLPLFMEGTREIFEKALPRRFVNYRRMRIARRREKKARKSIYELKPGFSGRSRSLQFQKAENTCNIDSTL